MNLKKWNIVTKSCVAIAGAITCAVSLYAGYSVTLCVVSGFISIFIWEVDK
jgi:hypothetical protein